MSTDTPSPRRSVDGDDLTAGRAHEEHEPTRVERLAEDRLRVSVLARSVLNHVFPKHWSFLLGEIALYSFVILVATGTYLAFFYEPSLAETTYEGSYEPLRGVVMSRAYESSVRLSWDVRAGLVMRQVHHWAALVFVAAITVHLLRNFFTGAFRRPREINWMVGVTLLMLAILNGFAGYSLLDDLLSGTGLRIAYSIALAIPVIGTWAAFLLFGGELPADEILSRLFFVHVFLVPAAIATLLTVHLALVWHQRHTQLPGPGRNDRNVVGVPLWPVYAAKSAGLLSLIACVLVLLGGLVQINPIWLYGPYDPSVMTTAAQPNWYMGWIEGALRLAGPWAFEIGPFTVSELFIRAIVLQALTFLALYAWPFIDRLLTGDREAHEVLKRPSEHPVRKAFGVAVLTFYVVLFVAGWQDMIATTFDVSVFTVLWTLRILLMVALVVTATIAYRLALDIQQRRRWRQEIDDEIDEVSAERDGAGKDGTEPQVNR